MSDESHHVDSTHLLYRHVMQKLFLFLLCALICSSSFAQKTSTIYEQRADHDPNGTGRFYMGREVAHVCQGGEWLERPERELEENAELMVESLQLKPGEIVVDVGAGTGYISRKLSKRVGEKGTISPSEKSSITIPK
ncbi:MAG: hypothetical protein ABIP71_03280 [Verrucomicrobiota bacterium]